MSFLQNLYDQEMVESVKEVVLGIWNPEDILNGSVCEVLTCETYEGQKPKVNGLFDLRMGTIEQGYTCETCHLDYRGCPGHFGHIRLVRPVYHMQFINVLMKIAKCFCYVCSECLIDFSPNSEEWKDIKKKPMKTRFTHVYKTYKDKLKTCKYCKASQPSKYFIPRNTPDNSGCIAKVYAEFQTTGGTKKKEYISCEQMLEFLKRIKNEDLDRVGIPSSTSRPDWMICTVFPVPPPHVRPSVRQENNQKSEDDLTHKLAEIITRNQTLREEIEKAKDSKDGEKSVIIDDWTQVLQYHVSTFIDNEIPGIPKAIQRSGRPIKAVKQRLQSKDGRMRNNLMGKRGDHTGRTVITAEPNIALDELGVPKKIAMNLTFPENVNKHNIERLKMYVKNGLNVYPGAKSVQKKIKIENGNIVYRMYSLSIKTIDIEIGDIVHRHLIDGDIVFFNRQPSLHKMSMMGHRVRVLEVGNTFRLNVSATSPYNADFDGDEMNVFLTQCMEGLSELKYLTLVPNQIVSPQKNQCVIGLVQDTLYTCPQITRENVPISRANWMNLMMYLNKFEMSDQELTGRRLFEKLLPKVNLSRATNVSKQTGKSEHDLVIEDGKIKQGVVDKNMVGTSSGGFIHLLWKDFNPQASADFIYMCQRICNQWLMNVGHSMGVSDCLFLNKDDLKVNVEEYRRVHDIIYNAVCEVNYLLERAKKGLYNTRSDKPIEMDIEMEIMHILNKARDEAGKEGIVNYILKENPSNRLIQMIMSGSKGDMNNASQIMCTMGQSEVAGARTPKKFSMRTLPHYPKYDNSPEARGFSMHSFKDGLDPNEFYFLAISTRVGLIDKTVKTADTGYTQRRLIKSMEDQVVHHDGSVRTANNSILQFCYGDDYFDATYLETLKFDYHTLSDEKFKKQFYTEHSIQEYNELFELKNQIKHVMLNNVSIYSPVNINRVLKEIINSNDKSREPIQVHDTIKKRDEVISYIKDYFGGDKIPEQMYMFVNYVTFELSYAKLIRYDGISRLSLDMLVDKIINKFTMAVCSAGEMVGIICGQSIGEPTTQMTLNTFHHIGVGSKSNTTTGVPRMKELLAVSKNIKTPSMTMYLRDGDVNKYSYEDVKQFSLMYEYSTFKDIVSNLDIFWENSDSQSVFGEDNIWLESVNEVEGVMEKVWVIRMKMNVEYCYVHNITAHMILEKIGKITENTGGISLIGVKHEQLMGSVYRMYIKFDEDTSNLWQILNRFVDTNLLNYRLKGIRGIKSVDVSKTKTLVRENADGSVTEEMEWVIYTTGSNLKDTLISNLEYNGMSLNKRRIRSNDIQEVFEVYGIEVAKQILIEEFQEVLSSTGGVNLRHITILVDTMTSKGQLIPIDRHGVKKNEIGPLSRATFEETVDQLLKAATFGEVDTMNGVSANIMMGQVAPCGTGTVELLLDESKILSERASQPSNVFTEDIKTRNQIISAIESETLSISKMEEKKTLFSDITNVPIQWFGVINTRVTL